MRYEGAVYRPPSEAYSLIVQITIGCSHNKCTFCNMYRGENFRVRSLEDVVEDLKEARSYYGKIEKIFLADGDALCLATDKLLYLLDTIKDIFPEAERISLYGSPQDVLRKTNEDLSLLKERGLGMVYIGAESGSDKLLKDICKGATREEIIKAVQNLEKAGIKASVTFISGLAGKEGWEDHAIETGTMISQMEPSYVGLLTLMLEEGTPLTERVKEGKFELLNPDQVIGETLLMLKNINVNKKCIFRSNHASNYLSLKGNLPEDKGRMIRQLEEALIDKGLLKEERFRML